MSILTLSACASPAVETSAPPASATAFLTQEATNVSATETVRETLLVWADETSAPAIEQAAAGFEGESGVVVQVETLVPGDIRYRLAERAGSGSEPDLFTGSHVWLGDLVTGGLVAAVDAGQKADQFLPAALDAFRYQGSLYGIPYKTENIAFICNTDLLDQYNNGQRPETWEQVAELAAIMEEESGGDATAWTIQTSDPYHLLPLLTAYGGYIFGRGESAYNPANVGLDSSGAIKAAQWLEGMAAAGHIDPEVDYSGMLSRFEDGRVACMGSGPWSLDRIRESDIPYSIGPFPAGDATSGRPFLIAQGFMISAASDQQQLARTFVNDYLATAELMQALYDAQPQASAFLPVRAAIDDKDIAGFAEAGSRGVPIPPIPEMETVWEVLGAAQAAIITDSADAETTFENAASEIRSASADGGG